MPPTTTETDPLPELGFDPILFWERHRTQLVALAVLLVVAVVGWLIFSLTSQKRLAAAELAYARAANTADLQAVAEKYPSLVVGANAELRVAGALRAEGKFDEALAQLRAFIERHPKHPLLSSAWMSLAATQEAQGKTDEALETYRQIGNKFGDTYAAPMALMAQADLLRVAGKKEEARTLYETVMARYQESVFARQAAQNLDLVK